MAENARLNRVFLCRQMILEHKAAVPDRQIAALALIQPDFDRGRDRGVGQKLIIALIRAVNSHQIPHGQSPLLQPIKNFQADRRI